MSLDLNAFFEWQSLVLLPFPSILFPFLPTAVLCSRGKARRPEAAAYRHAPGHVQPRKKIFRERIYPSGQARPTINQRAPAGFNLCIYRNLPSRPSSTSHDADTLETREYLQFRIELCHLRLVSRGKSILEGDGTPPACIRWRSGSLVLVASSNYGKVQGVDGRCLQEMQKVFFGMAEKFFGYWVCDRKVCKALESGYRKS